MSEEKTGGQIAYEAFYSSFPGSYLSWDAPGVGDVHDAWEAAAAAGAGAAHERTAELLTEVNDLRRHLGGLLTILLEGDEDDETVRGRAIDHVQRMLAAEPAVAGSGTGHLAALAVLACPACLSVAVDGVLTHHGLCPEPEARTYVAPLATSGTEHLEATP